MLRRPERKLQISAGFWLLAVWFWAVNGWRLLAMVLGAAAIHESGHWLVLRWLGAEPVRLHVGVLGMVMETDSRRLSYGRELAAVLAGPAANLLCACLLAVFAEGMEAAVGAQLVLGVFNLLPVRPLDGGRALYLLWAWLLGPDAADGILRWVGSVTALACGTGLCLLMRGTGGSLWLLPAAGGMLAAAYGEWCGKRSFL